MSAPRWFKRAASQATPSAIGADDDARASPDASFFALRSRAYDLADSGRFKTWDQIAPALRAEGFADDLIMRIAHDRLAVLMIARCCVQARSAE